MVHFGESVRYPIVISDDEEDAALVDQQLQLDTRLDITQSPSQSSPEFQRPLWLPAKPWGDGRREGTSERHSGSSSSRYVDVDGVRDWNMVDNQAGTPLTGFVSIFTTLK